MRTFLIGLVLMASCPAFSITVRGPARYMSVSKSAPSSDPLAHGATVGYLMGDGKGGSQYLLFGDMPGSVQEEIESVTLQPLDLNVPPLDFSDQLRLTYSYQLDSDWTEARIHRSIANGRWPNASGSFAGKLMVDTNSRDFSREVDAYLGSLKQPTSTATKPTPVVLKFVGKKGTTVAIHFRDRTAFTDFAFYKSWSPPKREPLLKALMACAAAVMGYEPEIEPPFQIFVESH